jgi:hypothetical protein
MLVYASICVGQGRDANEPVDYFRGDLGLRYENFWIDKDKGRFREDQWKTDGSSGGIERLYIESGTVDPNGYQVTLEGRGVAAGGIRSLRRREISGRATGNPAPT